jgi:hypothetical protein
MACVICLLHTVNEERELLKRQLIGRSTCCLKSNGTILKHWLLSAMKMDQPLFLEGIRAIRGERTIKTKTAFCQDDSVSAERTTILSVLK